MSKLRPRVIVCDDEPAARRAASRALGDARYDLVEKSWEFFLYPLDVTEVDGDWVGLSDITTLGPDRYAVIERDKGVGSEGIIKRVYEFSLEGVGATDGSPLPEGVTADQAAGLVIAKTLLKDAANAAFDVATALEIVTFQSDDHREALAALRERREPAFHNR